MGTGVPGRHTQHGKYQHPRRCVSVSLLDKCRCGGMVGLLGHVPSSCFGPSCSFSQLLRQFGRQCVRQTTWKLCSEKWIYICSTMHRSYYARGVVRRCPSTPRCSDQGPPIHATDAGVRSPEYACRAGKQCIVSCNPVSFLCDRVGLWAYSSCVNTSDVAGCRRRERSVPWKLESRSPAMQAIVPYRCDTV